MQTMAKDLMTFFVNCRLLLSYSMWELDCKRLDNIHIYRL